MISSHPPTPSTASPSQRSPWDLTLLARLVNSGINRDDILTIAKLDAASIGILFDIHREEGRAAVDELVGSLKTFPEELLGNLIDQIATSKWSFSLAERVLVASRGVCRCMSRSICILGKPAPTSTCKPRIRK